MLQLFWYQNISISLKVICRILFLMCIIYLQYESYTGEYVRHYDTWLRNDSIGDHSTAWWRVEWLSISVSMMRHGPPPYKLRMVCEEARRRDQETVQRLPWWESHPQTKYQARQRRQTDAVPVTLLITWLHVTLPLPWPYTIYNM